MGRLHKPKSAARASLNILSGSEREPKYLMNRVSLQKRNPCSGFYLCFARCTDALHDSLAYLDGTHCMTFTADVESVLAAAVRKHTKAAAALTDDQFLSDLKAHQEASTGTEDYHKKVLDFSLRVRLDEITVR